MKDNLDYILNNQVEYGDVIFKHNQSICNRRSETNIRVGVNGINLDSPVVLSNMPCVQNLDVLKQFNKYDWPYVYHRLGTPNVNDTITFLNNIQDWNLKSISVGVSNDDRELLKQIKKLGLNVDWITIDVALIYNINFEEYIKWVRKEFPNVYLIAGNFDNPSAALWLQKLGVNCGKFGIGVSKLCRTKQYTGFGTIAISDLYRCADLIERSDIEFDIMIDGGLQILNEDTGEIAYGDIFKSLNFGAKWVMSSALFRWCSELADEGGNIIQYGNSTARAKGHNRNVEGAVKTFKTNGETVKDRMNIISDNLRSSISYAGIRSVNDAYLSSQCKILK